MLVSINFHARLLKYRTMLRPSTSRMRLSGIYFRSVGPRGILYFLVYDSEDKRICWSRTSNGVSLEISLIFEHTQYYNWQSRWGVFLYSFRTTLPSQPFLEINTEVTHPSVTQASAEIYHLESFAAMSLCSIFTIYEGRRSGGWFNWTLLQHSTIKYYRTWNTFFFFFLVIRPNSPCFSIPLRQACKACRNRVAVVRVHGRMSVRIRYRVSSRVVGTNENRTPDIFPIGKNVFPVSGVLSFDVAQRLRHWVPPN